MRRDPNFQALVRHYELNGTVCLDEGPRYVETAGGKPRDVLAELLGDAPEPYVCVCGEEKAPAADVCRECATSDANFQQGGRW